MRNEDGTTMELLRLKSDNIARPRYRFFTFIPSSMRKLLLFSALPLALSISTVASAGMWDIAEDDLDAMSESLLHDAQQEATLRAEVLRESVQELFPLLPVETKTAFEKNREERTDSFVSVVIKGVTVVFRDVPVVAWYAPYVRTVAEKGIVNGYNDAAGNPLGLYKPQANVSVEELAKMVVMLSGGIGADCPALSRNATASGSWSVPYMACAEARTWTVYSDGTVNAKRFATRAEVIATVFQAFKKQPVAATGNVFKDVPSSVQFAAMIEQAKTDGLINGYTDVNGNPLGTFGPSDPVTRGELAKILTLADTLYVTKK
jgi:hypothetical protein